MTADVKSNSTNRDLAIRCAEHGFAVIPCSPRPSLKDRAKPDKGPIGALVPNGYKDATTDQDLIAYWWSKVPQALPGIVPASMDVVVIDIDVRPEVDASVEWLALAEKNGGLPYGTVVVKTIGRGWHLYFKAPTGLSLGNGRGSLPAGTDVRHAGGYVIAPGTIWRNGSWAEVRHSLLDAVRLKTLPTLPDWILKPLLPPKRPLSVRAARGFRFDRETDAERAFFEAALACIPSDDRGDWFRIGGALFDKFGESGRAMWDRWSMRSPKFSAAEQDRVWKSFSRPAANKCSPGTIIAVARQNGFNVRKFEVTR